MVKRWLLVVGMVLWLVGCGGETAPAAVDESPPAAPTEESLEPTAEKPNAEPTAAEPQSTDRNEGFVSLNTPVEGQVPANGRSYWSFTADAGDVVNISVAPQGGLDVVLDVLDEQGSSVLAAPVDDSFDAEELVGLELSAKGTYFVEVAPFEKDQSGPYRLSITAADAAADAVAQVEPTAVPPTAVPPTAVPPTAVPPAPTDWYSPGPLTYGTDVVGEIPAGGVSFWSFYGSPGEVVNVFVTPRGNADVVIDVMDEYGNSYSPSGPVDASYGEETLIGIDIPVDATYYVMVAEFSGQAATYDLRVAEVSGAGVTGDEYGDMFGGAGPHDRIEGPYSYGQGAVRGTIPEFGAASVWGLRTNPGDVVAIRVDPLNGQDVVIDVRHGPTGQSIFEDGPQDLEVGTELITGVIFPNGGDHSIVIYGFTSDDIGEYEMLVIQGE